MRSATIAQAWGFGTRWSSRLRRLYPAESPLPSEPEQASSSETSLSEAAAASPAAPDTGARRQRLLIVQSGRLAANRGTIGTVRLYTRFSQSVSLELLLLWDDFTLSRCCLNRFSPEKPFWYADLFSDQVAPRTAAGTTARPTTSPWSLASHRTTTIPICAAGADVRSPPPPRSCVDQLWRDRLRTLLPVDDLIGDIVAWHDDHGVLDDTYLIFSSDHGWGGGDGRVFPCRVPPRTVASAVQQTDHDETDVRVPLAVRGPGSAPGSQTGALPPTATAGG